MRSHGWGGAYCWVSSLIRGVGKWVCLSLTTQLRCSGRVWPISPSLPEMSTLTLLVLFLEHRIRDKANPLSARSAHKFWGDENILIQTKESQVQRTVLRMCFFPPFSPFLFPWYLELRRLLGEFITSGIFKDREPEVSLAFSFQGKSPRSVWYVHEWHEKKAVRGEGEDMPRIVNYEKKIACPKEWCVWLYSPDGVQHSGWGPCHTVSFLEVPWGLASLTHLWRQVTWSAGGHFPPAPPATAVGFVLWSILKRPWYFESLGWEIVSRSDLDWWCVTPSAEHLRAVQWVYRHPLP